MSIENDFDKQKKNVPLKDLLKKKNTNQPSEEENQSLVSNRKKIVIKKLKVVLKKSDSSENSTRDSGEAGGSSGSGSVKLVSSFDSGQSKRGPVKNEVSLGIKKSTDEAKIQESIQKSIAAHKERREAETRQAELDKLKAVERENSARNAEKSAPTSPVLKEKSETVVKPAESTGSDFKKKKNKDRRDQKKENWGSKKEKEGEEKLDKVIVFQGKHREPQQPKVPILPKQIEILETITVGDLAKKMNLKASDIIGKLMKLGMMTTINQVLDSDTATLVATEYGMDVRIVSLYEETIIEHTRIDRPEDHSERPPVITIMGHVDHGKTKLLDAIRESNVVQGEAGGITQHIGAYQVKIQGKRVTFLDTPGHEAFTLMRSRGAQVTDIVVLVVAADDGVMPQTMEAINHARDAKVPIIVAINKIDLETANPERIKKELSAYDLTPEDWGGQTIYVELSAKNKTNIDTLIEMILLQAEVLELRANSSIHAKGTIIEAKLDQGRGPVATVLIQHGTLRIGDPFVAGVYFGKVRAIFNDIGDKIEIAGPADPVEIIGLNGVPDAGDPFESVENERYAKQIAQKRQELKRHEESKRVQKITLEHLNQMIAKGDVKELKIIIKADVRGSAEALRDSLQNLSNDQVTVQVIHAGTGAINESDVLLAATSNAIIIGFHVRPNSKAADLASKENVDMKFYNIIYNVVDDIRGAMEGLLDPELQEQANGKGEVRETFKISRVGTIAGAYVLSGKIVRSHKVRLIREGEILFDGEFKSLKRFKEDVNEVNAGFEFGFLLTGFNDIQAGDSFETYEIKEVKQVLN